MSMFAGAGRRSGTRGGADQFKWDDVKSDKYKDYYLGHSLHTTLKPTFNNRKPNVLWWDKKAGQGTTEDKAAEIAAVKEQEEDLIRQALGQAPKRRLTSNKTLDSADLKELTKSIGDEPNAYDADRVKGLGFAPHRTHDFIEKDKSHLLQKLAEEDGAAVKTEKKRSENDDEWVERGEQRGEDRAGERGVDARGPRDREKSDKKKEKKEKKQRKKEKKREKKAKKQERKERDRDRDRGREREVDLERDRDRDRDRDRGLDRERERDRDYDRARDRGRERDREDYDRKRKRDDRDSDRDRERDSERDRDRDRDRDRHNRGDRDRDRDRERDRDRDREGGRERDAKRARVSP